jgi:acyl carrier protein
MNREQIFTALKSNIESTIEGTKGLEIKEEQSIVNDLGADSLEAVEVISRTMKQLKIKISRTDLSQVNNIKELLDLFEKSGAKVSG